MAFGGRPPLPQERRAAAGQGFVQPVEDALVGQETRAGLTVQAGSLVGAEDDFLSAGDRGRIVA